MNSQLSNIAAKDRGTILAEDRTEYAVGRTREAAERTLMAWIRTNLSMISFGFTIFKFFQYLQEAGTAAKFRPQAPRNLGIALVLLGTVMLTLAIVQHGIFLRRLRERSGQKLPVSLTMITALGISLIGLFALSNLLFKFGGF